MVGLPGPCLSPETAEQLRRIEPGGVILFGRNLESPGQTRRLLEDVRRLSSHPLLGRGSGPRPRPLPLREREKE
jgi:beta-glucosidase-like glycosyl hydrolase